MRRAVLELNPAFMLKFLPEDFFDSLERIEGKALLRLDLERGVKIAIADITMKEGATLEDLKIPRGFTDLEMLEKKGNTYTCLIRVKYDKKILNLLEFQPLKVFMSENIIFDFPSIFTKDKIVLTVITNDKYIRKILRVLEPLGLIRNISFLKPTFSDYNLLSCLTDRQKEVIIAAHKNGYYEVPREITAEELSKKLGISKATTVEHLRKAENRIISQIVTGY